MTVRSLVAITALAVWAVAFGREEVRWSGTVHNFGAFDEETGAVDASFTFVNTGTEPVSITAARASCGCTVPRYTTRAVAPGDSGTVTVTYNPAGRPGRFDKYVAVDMSYPGSRVKLHVTGTVIGSVGSIGQRFPVSCGTTLRLNNSGVLFGNVQKDRMRTAFVTGYNTGHDTIVPAVTSVPPFVEVRFEPEAVPPGEQVSVACFFRSDLTPLYGLVADSIAISAGGDDPGCIVPIVANVQEDFTRLTPGEVAKAPVARMDVPVLDFGILGRSDAPQTRTVVLHNDGPKRSLEIRRVYTADPGVSVGVDRNSVKKGKEAIVSVTVDPSALPGAMLNARVIVITNDPTNSVITLRAVGELR